MRASGQIDDGKEPWLDGRADWRLSRLWSD